MTDIDKNKESENKSSAGIEIYAERAEQEVPEVDAGEMRSLVLAYAKYLKEHGLEPGDPTFADDIEPEVTEAAEPEASAAGEDTSDDAEAEAPSEEPGKAAEKSGKKAAGKSKPLIKGRPLAVRPADAEVSEEEIAKCVKELESSKSLGRILSSPLALYDRIQDKIALDLAEGGREAIRAGHRIASTYRQSRRIIGIALLIMGILAALILSIFDRYTAFEYAYNGKVLGYVKNQEDVTDVLEIAGEKLSENLTGDTEVQFIANQNVTFNLIDARGRSIDDADIAVNKLVYMTDIETEAYGIYDGGKLKAIAKSPEDAERLLDQAREALSQPDEGMQVRKSEYVNDTEVRPLNVLLTSIQSNSAALKMMTEGGSMKVFHIVEDGENILSLAKTYGVEPVDVYTEDNKEVAIDIEKGDTVCIHEEIEPVRVKMVEKGRMKEILEFETIKKESEDYYKGDTHIEQEGIDGVQIFEGSITKISGEVTDRDPDNIEVITEKQDKIILVGTAERPKTAATGTYIVPLDHYEGITSPFGYRWGRLHSGIDMGASRGTPIHATDGGTIQRAGWYYGYGLCVEIDHGNGRMTRYGHCSALLVNVGDKVYQGQEIALVGNTGHSFGNHLHFEVNFNGTPVDPRPYLGI